MALPMLVGGSECGPSNALQGLTKRFDQDRGLQQDYFGAARAGSSRTTFRQNTTPAQSDPDAQRFFAQNASGRGVQLASDIPSFDVSAMRAALPPIQMQQHQQQHHMSQMQPTHGTGAGASSAAWAADFLLQQPASSITLAGSVTAYGVTQQDPHHPIHTRVQPSVQTAAPWNPAVSAFRMNAMPAFMPQLHAQPLAVASKRISWDREFSAHELNLTSTDNKEIQQPQGEAAVRKEFEGDELARTAGLLLEHIKHEQNPKFQKSQFLGLMKQLRDGEVIVDGNKVVESDGGRASSMNVDVKGKGRAIDPMASVSGPPRPQWASEFSAQGLAVSEQHELHGETQHDTVEDPNDAYFRQENADYTKYWSEAARQHEGRGQDANAASLGMRETKIWDKLQEDWDRFEATASGIRPLSQSQYAFQASNPYLLGEASKTRHHMVHLGQRRSMLENALELEAAVQRDPSNAAIWYELGVKQQENEREGKALQALRQAVELDPSYLHAWLALAISYTNDNDRQGTYEAVTEWVNRNEKYQEAAQAFRVQAPLDAHAAVSERFSHLIQCLIAMARSDVTGDVDADIQIALAVLLNTNEEYEKAQDCFRAALAVRPDDWLLYNRVGATMANSGRAEEALQYYYKALEFNPGYIRARFNLGISCMNLRRYDEAAQHILDALSLQDSDTTELAAASDKHNIMSTALWDSLKTTSLHLQRSDLAELCDSKDLEGFRMKFYG